jgi:hypothetical protein
MCRCPAIQGISCFLSLELVARSWRPASSILYHRTVKKGAFFVAPRRTGSVVGDENAGNLSASAAHLDRHQGVDKKKLVQTYV